MEASGSPWRRGGLGSPDLSWQTTWYETAEEMQKDLDVHPETYNQHRPHRGRGMEGRTPYAVFEAGIPRKRARKPSAGKEVKKAA